MTVEHSIGSPIRIDCTHYLPIWSALLRQSLQ